MTIDVNNLQNIDGWVLTGQSYNSIAKWNSPGDFVLNSNSVTMSLPIANLLQYCNNIGPNCKVIIKFSELSIVNGSYGMAVNIGGGSFQSQGISASTLTYEYTIPSPDLSAGSSFFIYIYYTWGSACTITGKFTVAIKDGANNSYIKIFDSHCPGENKSLTGASVYNTYDIYWDGNGKLYLSGGTSLINKFHFNKSLYWTSKSIDGWTAYSGWGGGDVFNLGDCSSPALLPTSYEFTSLLKALTITNVKFELGMGTIAAYGHMDSWYVWAWTDLYLLCVGGNVSLTDVYPPCKFNIDLI